MKIEVEAPNEDPRILDFDDFAHEYGLKIAYAVRDLAGETFWHSGDTAIRVVKEATDDE